MSLEALRKLDEERAAIEAMAIKDPPPKPKRSARIIYDMPEHIYHADPCEVPSLTQSIAHELVCGAPILAWLKHPKLGNAPRKVTEDMEHGSAFHAMILGKGSDIVAIDADSFRGAHAQEMAAIAREAHKVPLLTRKRDAIATAAEAARKKIEAFGYRFNGASEVSVMWEEVTTWGEVVICRARFDHLCDGKSLIIDVKKCADANPANLPHHMTTYGYDIQEVAYRRALVAVFPGLAGRDDFVFQFCELPPPHIVTPLRSAATMHMLGERKWQMAIDKWAHCLSSGVWSDYATETVRAEAKPWDLSQFGIGG
ncbi:MAG: PD-(D/E)XK nuclease-like domain-containing protein [Brevundimonas sp.]